MVSNPAGSRICPVCREPIAEDAAVCPNCGARLTAPIDALMKTLEALEGVADRSLADELDDLSKSAAVAKRRIPPSPEARAPRLEAPMPSRPAHDVADLSGFVARLEAVRGAPVGELTRGLPPKAHPFSAATVGIAAVVGATGLLFVPSSPLVGGLLIVAAMALGAAGIALRSTPAQ